MLLTNFEKYSSTKELVVAFPDLTVSTVCLSFFVAFELDSSVLQRYELEIIIDGLHMTS